MDFFFTSSPPFLSIPLWFDWGPAPPSFACAALCPLSIPLWFDWGPGLARPGGAKIIFQSHFGSIGARLFESYVLSVARAFNPTLVRLGLVGDSRRFLQQRLAFNPTLVRLGLHAQRSARGTARHFQSHFGSIGAVAGEGEGSPPPPFQSHFGSIGAPFVGRSCRLMPPFQSHFGSIGAVACRHDLSPTA